VLPVRSVSWDVCIEFNVEWFSKTDRSVGDWVETYPYRNGSKVVVFSSIKGAVIGDTVDFSRTYDSLLREIERIIKA